MNLVIDIGNTRLKYGIFNNDTLLTEGSAETGNEFDIEPLLNKYSIKNSIVCSVARQPEELLEKLKTLTNYIDFTIDTPIPIKNLYKSKQTLGSDRLTSAIGAYSQFPGTNILVIDTGTCIKYNFVTAQHEYIGGAISPGIDMRFKALDTFTHKLPLVNADYTFDTLIGTDTQQSILSGVMNGATSEIEGIIDQYVKQYNSLKIVMTGGNHSYFVKRVKRSIFADPFLILKGLNAVVKFNVPNSL